MLNKVIGSPDSPLVTLAVVCSHPSAPDSGDPVLVGGILPGVACIDEDTDGETVIDFGPGVFALEVEAIDGNGNSAVTHGQKIYFDLDGDPALNKKADGVPFGIAYSKTDGTKTGNLITAGATATILVLLVPGIGVGTMTSTAAVGSDQLAENMLQQAVVEIDSATITGTSAGQLGHANGVELVATPGAGKVLELVSAILFFDYSTKAYTGGGNITVNIGSGGAALTGLISFANSIGASADKIVQFNPLAAAATALTSDKGINLVAASAPTQPDTAAGVARVFVTYRVHTLAGYGA